MIKNIPDSNDFKILAQECFFKAFDMIFSIHREWYYSVTIEKEGYFEQSEHLEYNDVTLRTSLIVLHQGVEYYLKYYVAKKSPLFLLDKQPSELPYIPHKSDKDFNELNMISGDNLISIYCGLSEKTEDELTKICSNYDKLRIQRNIVTHSISSEKTSIKLILENFLFFNKVFNNENWFSFLKRMYRSNPIFGIDDSELEESDFHLNLDFVEKHIDKNLLQKEIDKVDTKSRRYLCPKCAYQISRYEYYPEISKWAFLKPNEPNSKKVFCLVCEKESTILREDCKIEDCKGNVTHENTCLTCYNGGVNKSRVEK